MRKNVTSNRPKRNLVWYLNWIFFVGCLVYFVVLNLNKFDTTQLKNKIFSQSLVLNDGSKVAFDIRNTINLSAIKVREPASETGDVSNNIYHKSCPGFRVEVGAANIRGIKDIQVCCKVSSSSSKIFYADVLHRRYFLCSYGEDVQVISRKLK